MLACLTAVCLLTGRAEAGGIATDTLTVKVCCISKKRGTNK